jgi:hypothetical protein
MLLQGEGLGIADGCRRDPKAVAMIYHAHPDPGRRPATLRARRSSSERAGRVGSPSE